MPETNEPTIEEMRELLQRDRYNTDPLNRAAPRIAEALLRRMEAEQAASAPLPDNWEHLDDEQRAAHRAGRCTWKLSPGPGMPAVMCTLPHDHKTKGPRRMCAFPGDSSHLPDQLHPTGRCACAGEGTCAWCLSHCTHCGAGMDRPAVDDAAARERADILRWMGEKCAAYGAVGGDAAIRVLSEAMGWIEKGAHLRYRQGKP